MMRKNKNQSLQKPMRRRVKLAVIPNEANEYRPHLIRRYGLLFVLLLVIGVQAVYNFNIGGSVLSGSADVSQEALLREANQARADHDLNELRLNDKLNKAAYLKAKDMFANQYWGHTSPSGVEPWKWLADVEYGYTRAGENLAKNFYTAEATTTAWMNSPEHRANILEPDYTEAGFAVATGELDGQTTTIVVALYGRPTGLGVVTPGATVAVASAKSSPGLLARIGIGVQSITPAALGSIVVLAFLMMVSFISHMYRDHIPASPRQPRHRHNHGVIKIGLMFAFIIGMLLLYGGGQI